MLRRPPRSTLLPDTTLTRSRSTRSRRGGRRPPSAAAAVPGKRPPPPSPAPPPPRGAAPAGRPGRTRSEEHTSELQSRQYLVCRLLLEKKTYQSFRCHLVHFL